MDILKDASATAIYGSRGANGVVLITTKKGKAGEPVISVGASVGLSNLREKPKVLSAAQFREALQYYTPSEAADADFGSNVDAFDAITRTAGTQNYYADVSGGTKHGKYRVSGGFMDQKGIVIGSELKKYTTNFTGNFRFLENRRLGLDFSLFYTQINIISRKYNISVARRVYFYTFQNRQSSFRSYSSLHRIYNLHKLRFITHNFHLPLLLRYNLFHTFLFT